MNTATETPPDDGRILIVGGYGQVGRLIAERLALIFPNRVTVAGRNLGKARATAVEIGHGTEGHVVDIFADYTFLSEVEKLDDLAKRNGTTAMLSVGGGQLRCGCS